MKPSEEKQDEAVCTRLLQSSGIKKGQTILDFGCGNGTYTIPAAEIAGSNGSVYAIDENASKLAELSQKCKTHNLTNVSLIKTNGELHFDFANAMFDAVLLYDIFWYFPAGNRNLITLLNEVYRVCKNKALVSVYPEHTDTEQLKNILINSGFTLVYTYSGDVIHEDTIVHGQIFNLIKEGKNE